MSRWQADLTLVFITVIWGSTFVMVKNALDDVQPMTFVAWRFWIATLVLVFLFRQQARTISRAEWRAGMLIGLFLAMGYIFQTIGLQYTTSAKAGFITGLNIVLVPIFSAMLLRQAPGRWAMMGVVLATVGLALLSLNADLTLQRGDAWVMACAVAFALHIVSISHFTARHSAISLAIVQIATVALAATLAAFVFEQPRVRLPLDTWGAIAFTGVVATALVFSLQTYVQRFTTATHTALIFSLEPVFAALFGWWWAGEVLGLREVVGSTLILGGMLVAELGALVVAQKNLELEEA